MRVGNADATTGKRALSNVVGIALLIVVVVILVAVSFAMFLSMGQSELSEASVHSRAHFDLAINTTGAKSLTLHPQVRSQGYSESRFVLKINGDRVHSWEGRQVVELQCLYPGDHIHIFTEDDEGQTRPIQDLYVDQTTECPQFNTFPSKFQYGIVEGERHEINDRYAFGLSIVPNGDDPAVDYSGSKTKNLGKISLANPWHHVRLYEGGQLEGLEPPVFVMVMVDNVHWEHAPDPAKHSEVSYGDYYNWTDDPPDGLTLGENAYTISGGGINFDTDDTTEPTDDVFMLFKPGCDESTVLFVGQDAGYTSEIYLEGTEIIDNTNDNDNWDKTFSVPGVKCRGDASW
jgi:hypothetical protein